MMRRLTAPVPVSAFTVHDDPTGMSLSVATLFLSFSSGRGKPRHGTTNYRRAGPDVHRDASRCRMRAMARGYAASW